jgi:hypothetical protein
MLERRPWPRMNVTDTPCTTAVVSAIYTCRDAAGQRIKILVVRRAVYDPQGVTFDTLHEILHRRGRVMRAKGCAGF